ncbi:MAG: restriction endonuclease subunit S, partial [Bacillota bacterium]|nr:restriction endonuclease subunit S [Bacillota bacterium]
ATFTRPEAHGAVYIHAGDKKPIFRKAALTKLASDICFDVFDKTPTVVNEVINRDEPTSIACNSRTKIVAALLRTELEPNLGLTGTGQEVSIMRSTLVRTGILSQEGTPTLNLVPDDERIAHMLKTIEGFILKARHVDKLPMTELYELLTGATNGIGMRRGLIPIYLAVVLHQYKQHIVLNNYSGQVPVSADILNLINSNPEGFFISHLDWDADKEKTIQCIARIFGAHVIEAEKGTSAYDYAANAMRRWYMSLPRYAKECKVDPFGNKIDKRFLGFLRELKSVDSNYNLMFKKLPKAFDYQEFSCGLSENIEKAYEFYSTLLDKLVNYLEKIAIRIFAIPGDDQIERKSLSSVICDWCETLPPAVYEQLFPDGTERILGLLRVATNDDDTLMRRLAKLVTGLRIEDWDSSTVQSFEASLIKHKETAEAFECHESKIGDSVEEMVSDYQVSYIEDGKVVTKRFDKVDRSKRSNLLFNQISSALKAMGQSISEQEKRQVIMEILQKLC